MRRAASSRGVRSAIVLACLAFGGGGCVQVTDFEPVGVAASISGGWTIDGAPPTAESCEALGASVVRVTFVDELRPVPHGNLFFPCATECTTDGALLCFDTGDAKVVAEGTWTIRLEAVDGAGVIAASPEQVHSTEAGHIALDTAPFFTGRISAEVTVGGAPPSFSTCGEAGIAAVEIAFDVAGGAVAGPAIDMCTTGGVGTRVAPGATYTVRLRALDPNGAVLGESAPETFEIERGEHVVLNGGQPIELTRL